MCLFAYLEVIMTQTQIKNYIKKAEKITKKATASQAEARKILVKYGFSTKDGRLRKEYRP
jgi:hypothetical protein